jgi:hypothetical protein
MNDNMLMYCRNIILGHYSSFVHNSKKKERKKNNIFNASTILIIADNFYCDSKIHVHNTRHTFCIQLKDSLLIHVTRSGLSLSCHLCVDVK